MAEARGSCKASLSRTTRAGTTTFCKHRYRVRYHRRSRSLHFRASLQPLRSGHCCVRRCRHEDWLREPPVLPPGDTLWGFLFKFWAFGVAPTVIGKGGVLTSATGQILAGSFSNLGSSIGGMFSGESSVAENMTKMGHNIKVVTSTVAKRLGRQLLTSIMHKHKGQKMVLESDPHLFLPRARPITAQHLVPPPRCRISYTPTCVVIRPAGSWLLLPCFWLLSASSTTHVHDPLCAAAAACAGRACSACGAKMECRRCCGWATLGGYVRWLARERLAAQVWGIL